jgi:signal transduction histidine kinase
MLSHEIRTPLTLMSTSLELLFDESAGPLTEQQRTFLETMYQNEERIATLAQNLLTQARLESGLFSPKTQPVDLRRIVRLVVNDMRILIEQRKQQIRTYYPQVLPPVPADPALIRQVLINMIQNASRHTSEGGLIIVSIAQNDYNLLVSVTDDGAGMGLDHRRQLFKRFATSGGNSGEGTGLGLVTLSSRSSSGTAGESTWTRHWDGAPVSTSPCRSTRSRQGV